MNCMFCEKPATMLVTAPHLQGRGGLPTDQHCMEIFAGAVTALMPGPLLAVELGAPPLQEGDEKLAVMEAMKAFNEQWEKDHGAPPPEPEASMGFDLTSTKEDNDVGPLLF